MNVRQSILDTVRAYQKRLGRDACCVFLAEDTYEMLLADGLTKGDKPTEYDSVLLGGQVSVFPVVAQSVEPYDFAVLIPEGPLPLPMAKHGAFLQYDGMSEAETEIYRTLRRDGMRAVEAKAAAERLAA